MCSHIEIFLLVLEMHSGPSGCTASTLTTAQHQGLELSLHDNVPEKLVINMGQLVNQAALKALLLQDLNSRSLTRLWVLVVLLSALYG